MFTRETRLLLMTMAFSVVVVLALSTLRFPQTQPAPEAPPAPLERLAATAAYEQLARSVERVSRLITPALLPLRYVVDNGGASRSVASLLDSPLGQDVTRYSPALRVDGSRAVVVGVNARAQGTFLDRQGTPVAVIAADQVRQLTVLAVPPERTTQTPSVTASDLQAPTYVVVAEGTAAGVTFRPVFVGSADRFSDARWAQPLLAVSGSPLTNPGALVFSLDGAFIGAAVVAAGGGFAVAAAMEVMSAAREPETARLAATRDFGLHLQPLTPSLGQLLRVAQGVVVAAIDSGSPAAAVLDLTDVITSVDGVTITNPDDALARLARSSGDAVQIGLVRNGQPQTVSVAAVRPPGEDGNENELPQLERVPGQGVRVTALSDRTPPVLGDLQVGDVVVRAGTIRAPTPQEVTQALRAAVDGSGVVLVVRREGAHRVVAVPASGGTR